MDNINLEKWYRPKIDHATLKQLSVRSDWAGIRHMLIYFGALLASGLMVFATWGTW